jgi:hypothetical protein
MTFRLIYGAATAGALALVAAGASIAGIAAWKVIAALLGFGLFVLGGRARK